MHTEKCDGLNGRISGSKSHTNLQPNTSEVSMGSVGGKALAVVMPVVIPPILHTHLLTGLWFAMGPTNLDLTRHF
jgi:hypothetical protein